MLGTSAGGIAAAWLTRTSILVGIDDPRAIGPPGHDFPAILLEFLTGKVVAVLGKVPVERDEGVHLLLGKRDRLEHEEGVGVPGVTQTLEERLVIGIGIEDPSAC